MVEKGGGTHRPSPIKPPVRRVSDKPPGRSEVRPPVKTAPTSPSKPRSVINEGVRRHIAALSAESPQYIVPYEPNPNTVGSARYNPWLGARGKYGDVLTQSEWDTLSPNLKFKANMGYTVIPDEQPQTQYYYYEPKQKTRYYGGGGGGGGGGGAPAPPVPTMKIRTTAGIRRSPYWESEDPYTQGFEPRFVVLGNQQAW